MAEGRHRGRSEAGLSTLEQTLRRTIKGDVLFDAASRGRYSTDASIYQVEPVGVVLPRDETDLALVLDVARDAKAAILPRGAGTSQCGQTVGQALVVDVSKYMREVVGFDKNRAEVTVQPGVVLDQLNAWLKPHGLWYPVDVSTSAQCTLGGMAGNNSCGSRSIRYGNMVHNVASIDALLMNGERARFGSARPEDMPAAVRAIADKVAALAFAERDEIERLYPKVLRRVGGYNLDIFFPQSERPYTLDNSVNLAHLLVGSEGTLAVTERLTLKLAPAAQAQDPGRGELPELLQGDGKRPAHRQAEADRRRAGRPHHDRAGARQSRLPAGDRARPDRPARGHPAGRVRGRGARGATARSAAPGRADGRSRPAQKRRRDARAPAAGRAVGSAQGRAQHHDVDEGRRKTRVLHRGLRRAAGASRGVHTAPDRRLHQARHQGHVVRPRLGRHPACAADPRHAPRGRRQDARDRRGGLGDGARVQGRLLGRARRRAGALGMGGLAVRAAAHQGDGRGQGPVRSRGPAQSRQDRAALRRWTTARCSASSRATGTSTTSPRSIGRPGTSRTIR